MKNHAKIISSLYASCGITFTDKVKNELRKDLSKNWKISMIADKFNISEVSVRKRLSSEKHLSVSYYFRPEWIEPFN